VARGKGGVGKSLIAANLAVALAAAGQRVVLVDLDLGGSNAHTILGVRSTPGGIGSVLHERGARLEDVMVATNYANLTLVPGDAEIPGVANLLAYQKRRLIKQLLHLDCDVLILDLGAGTSFNTLDFFLLGNDGLLVITPTLTSILNGYLFLKNVVFRVMSTAFRRGSPGADHMASLQRDGASLQSIYVPRLAAKLRSVDPENFAQYAVRLAQLRPRLIHNMLEDASDEEQAGKLRRSVTEYLGIELRHLGVVFRDDLQDTALSSRLPIVVYKPGSVLSQGIFRIADKVLEEGVGSTAAPNSPTPETDDAEPDVSFAAAVLEADADFSTKLGYVEELLNSGALTPGDLIETVRSQQYEIGRLKKEVQLLRTKLVAAAKGGFAV
jgi:flagellar biosynthesis protein FlhG